MILRKMETIQLRGVHPRNPVTNELIPAYLQWFMVTSDMDGETIDPANLTPRPDLHHGITGLIPVSEIVAHVGAERMLRAIGMIKD